MAGLQDMDSESLRSRILEWEGECDEYYFAMCNELDSRGEHPDDDDLPSYTDEPSFR